MNLNLSIPLPKIIVHCVIENHNTATKPELFHERPTNFTHVQ